MPKSSAQSSAEHYARKIKVPGFKAHRREIDRKSRAKNRVADNARKCATQRLRRERVRELAKVAAAGSDAVLADAVEDDANAEDVFGNDGSPNQDVQGDHDHDRYAGARREFDDDDDLEPRVGSPRQEHASAGGKAGSSGNDSVAKSRSVSRLGKDGTGGVGGDLPQPNNIEGGGGPADDDAAHMPREERHEPPAVGGRESAEAGTAFLLDNNEEEEEEDSDDGEYGDDDFHSDLRVHDAERRGDGWHDSDTDGSQSEDMNGNHAASDPREDSPPQKYARAGRGDDDDDDDDDDTSAGGGNDINDDDESPGNGSVDRPGIGTNMKRKATHGERASGGDSDSDESKTKKSKQPGKTPSESATPSRNEAIKRSDLLRVRKMLDEPPRVARAPVWNSTKDAIENLGVVMYSQNLSLKRLGDNEGLVADAFDEMHDHWDYLKLSKYRMGKLVLPPGAVKVMECASQNALTVTVTSCRDLSLRLDFAHPKKRVFKRVTDRRFRLCRDDMFRLLPGNRVRLNNCSKDCAVEMTFTIIRSSAPNEPLMRDNRELSRVVQDQQREIRALRSKVRRLEGLQTLTG